MAHVAWAHVRLLFFDAVLRYLRRCTAYETSALAHLRGQILIELQ